MSSLALLLDSPSEINKKIQELEKQREVLQNAPIGSDATNNDDLNRATEVSKSLHVAILNNDVNSIEALILSYGELPSLLKALDLTKLKVSLEKERFDQIQYQEILKRLNQSVLEFNFAQLSEIKSEIEKLASEQLRERLFQQLTVIVESFKTELVESFRELIKASKWINTGVIADDLQQSFNNLLNLQSLGRDDNSTLWAFEIVASNFKISFDYHFNSSQETNRIDKPELFFKYHISYIEQHLNKINKVWSLHDTSLSQLSAHSEYIKASLIPVLEKFQQFLKVIDENQDDSATTDILIHLVNETLQYDDQLINQFYYDPLYNGKWGGLFQEFSYELLEKWLKREVQVNLNNFEHIVSSENCFHIDYTSVNSDDLKPTVSAMKLKILFENITKNFSKVFRPQYDSLSQLNKFKLKFFSKIYIYFLDLYLVRLDEGYDALNELFRSNKSVISSSKGTTAGIDISGTNGLERIFRIYSSIKFISNSLNLWNQEFIFIDINSLFRQFSSSNILTESLFSSILKDFNRLESKTWSLLENFISRTINTLSKGYTSLSHWNEINPDQGNIVISNELLTLIDVLNEYDLFISKIITKRQTSTLKNFISLKIAELFFNSIIKSNQFNSSSIHQLSFDYNTVWEKLHLNTQFPLYFKIIEALKVLSLDSTQISQFTNITLSQYAKIGNYADIKEFLSLRHLNDSDILDVLLRMH